MKRPWLLVLLLHLAFFGAWTALEEWRHHGAPEFLLETEGADPRDLLAGDYLALAFPAGRLDAGLQGLPDGSAVAVRLQAVTDPRPLGWPLRQAVESRAAPGGDYSGLPAGEGWARAEISHGRLRFGIERYYFPEDQAGLYRALRPGRYYARVSLSPDGRLRIRQLVW